MEQEMTTRPSIRWRDLVAHLDGEVVAARAVSVERAFSIIATGGAVARGCQPTSNHPSDHHQLAASVRSSAGRLLSPACCTIRTNCFYCGPLRDIAAADIPVVIAPRDQIELVRVLPDYTSCQ
jgi:hypothetical protein